MLKNAGSDAKIGVDTVENEPLKDDALGSDRRFMQEAQAVAAEAATYADEVNVSTRFLHENQHLTLVFLHQQRDLVELCFKHL